MKRNNFKAFNQLHIKYLILTVLLLYSFSAIVNCQDSYLVLLDSVMLARKQHTETLEKPPLHSSDSNYWIYGREYLYNHHGIIGSPFFLKSRSLKGSISFNNNIYQSENILYDIRNEELAIGLDDVLRSHEFITLEPHWVNAFTIYHKSDTFNFTHLKNEDIPLPFGFYEVLFSDNNGNQLIKKYRKNLYSTVLGNTLRSTYEDDFEHYYIKNNLVFPINKKKDFYRAFKENKKNVKKEIKNFSKRFKKFTSSDLSILLSKCIEIEKE